MSTPAIAGMPFERSSVASWRASSRTAAVAWATTRPRSHGRADWSSSRQPAVVADQRVGHHDDLARVRRVGGDLLVAGLRGVDDEVAAGGDRGAERDAGEHGAVLEREERGTGVADAGIDERVGARQRRMRKGRWGDHGFPAARGRRAAACGAACGHAHAHLATSYPASRDRYDRPHGTGNQDVPSVPRDRRAAEPADRAARSAATARSGRGASARRGSDRRAPAALGPGGRRQLGAEHGAAARAGSRRRCGRRGAPRSSVAIARPRPVPPGRRARARARSGRRRGACPPSRTPGPWSRDLDRGERAGRRGPWTVDRAAARAVADGVVDEDRHQLAEARRVAVEHRGLRVHADAHAARLGRPAERADAASNATSPRSSGMPLERHGAGVRAGEEQQVVDQRGEVGRPRRRCRRARRRTPRPARSRWRCRCSTEERMTVSGVRSSWLASAANSRWRRRATRCASSDWRIGTSARRAYSGPEPERDEHHDAARRPAAR